MSREPWPTRQPMNAPGTGARRSRCCSPTSSASSGSGASDYAGQAAHETSFCSPPPPRTSESWRNSERRPGRCRLPWHKGAIPAADAQQRALGRENSGRDRPGPTETHFATVTKSTISTRCRHSLRPPHRHAPLTKTFTVVCPLVLLRPKCALNGQTRTGHAGSRVNGTPPPVDPGCRTSMSCEPSWVHAIAVGGFAYSQSVYLRLQISRNSRPCSTSICPIPSCSNPE